MMAVACIDGDMTLGILFFHCSLGEVKFALELYNIMVLDLSLGKYQIVLSSDSSLIKKIHFKHFSLVII